jgi:ABC-type uncharacterized transport system substrate-binding protein
MIERSWMRWPISSSDNRKSKISNRKLVGIVALVVTFTLCGAVVDAQPTAKISRIGILDVTNASATAGPLETFRQGMRKLGWIEGKNITAEYRFAEGKFDRLPSLAADLVRLKVDLIVTTGRGPALAAKNATSAIPIVMMNFPDPVGEGLVASLARPGGNVTGFSASSYELSTKRLEILKDTVPNLTRVGALQQGLQGGARADLSLKELMAAALALKLKLQEIESETDAKGLENAFRSAKQKQVGALVIGGGRLFFAERKRIVELVGKYRLPAVYPQKEYVTEGGLMSYGVDFDDQYRRAAGYVDKILKGAKPADLPVQQATKFEFVINLKAAKQIGLTVPPEVLARADRVIK